jgi:hypothetical protein
VPRDRELIIAARSDAFAIGAKRNGRRDHVVEARERRANLLTLLHIPEQDLTAIRGDGRAGPIRANRSKRNVPRYLEPHRFCLRLLEIIDHDDTGRLVAAARDHERPPVLKLMLRTYWG